MSLKMMSLIRIGLVVLAAVVISECIRETARPTPGPGRPRTGVLTKKLTGQRGKLRIKNKNNLDAVIVLTLPDEPEEALIAVYVRAGDAFMTTGIKSGLYRCYFAFGEDWDSDSKRFTRNASYFRFKKPFDFTRRRRKYSVWTVTLGVDYADETAWYKKLRESEFPSEPKRSELSYRVIFTTGLTKNDQPVNNLKEISIDEECIYIYVTWFSISDGEHNYLCKMFDGSGTLVTTGQVNY